jgi:hypothetical protein
MNRRACRTPFVALTCSLVFGAVAQPAAAPAVVPAAAAASAPAIEFATVAQALTALEARDGAGTVVTHADGWTIVTDPVASTQWTFAPAGHEAYPSVVRRVIRHGQGGATSVETSSLCESAAPACDRLLAEFASMNERILQAARARGRQGSSSRQP